LNKWLSNLPFWQLEQLLSSKAEDLGKKIVKVDARYTSQKCSNCSQIENRNGSHYVCDRCGYTENADVNAAKNIRNNLICAAVKPKVQPALVNESIVALTMTATSHQPCAGVH
jgi:transposase